MRPIPMCGGNWKAAPQEGKCEDCARTVGTSTGVRCSDRCAGGGAQLLGRGVGSRTRKQRGDKRAKGISE